ncbi:alanine--glyoxylate aminotransferase family protein [Candidatus Sumerlaeota bacterium]|nr:alanine--glyoxylate aminotransferase family protein [Candidatus Sumerlaeota bacterium]
MIAGELNPTPRFLMGPGPSDAHPRVLRAMATPLIGHLDPQFIEVMNETRAMLQEIMRTENEMTFAVSAPGSAGMETCLINLLEPGDEALICVNGVFGNRMADIVERCGAKLVRVDAPWGEIIEPAQVRAALGTCRPRLVAIVHGETSTGVCQPLEEIGRLTHEAGALFLVDAVTSLAGVDVRVDDWGIDALYSGTQKCLSAPPGMSPITLSPRAMKVVTGRKTKVQSWFLDLNLVASYVTGGAKRSYHHTAPISNAFALREALRLVLEEGIEARFERHRRIHGLLRDGLEELGFEFVVKTEHRLPQLNAVRLPAGLDDATARRRLLEEFNIEVGAGLGDFAGKVWRIGLMGCSCTENHVNMLLAALRRIMAQA